VCVCVTVSGFSPTSVLPIDFTFDGSIAEVPRKCGVECDAVRISDSREILKAIGPIVPFRNRHGTGDCAGGCVLPKDLQGSAVWSVMKWFR